MEPATMTHDAAAHEGAAHDAARLSHLGELTPEMRERLRTCRVLLAGLGNIGSWLALLLSSLVGSVRLVDKDRVDLRRNRLNQAYCEPTDDGCWKTEAIARMLRRMAPELTVEVWTGDLQHLPHRLVADVDIVLGALDSLLARQRLISRLAWPLGKTVIDGGVGQPLLGRVHVLHPRPEWPCLECPWDANTYRQLAIEQPCHPGATASIPRTVSLAAQGASVASLMITELVNELCGRGGEGGRELNMNFAYRRFQVLEMRRSSSCRFDHEVVAERIELPVEFSQATIGDVCAAAVARFGASADLRFEMPRVLRRTGAWDSASVFALPVLSHLAATRLTDLGFDRGDWVRVYPREGASAFVLLSPVEVRSGRQS